MLPCLDSICQYCSTFKKEKGDPFSGEGRIDTDNKRQGKSKRDAYRVRGKSLVSKGKEIQNITDCEVFIDVVPTWKNGKRWIYKSPGYQETFERGDDTSLTTSHKLR